MNNIHLISVGFIKKYSPLMDNVDDDIVKIHITESQDIDMRFLIGDSLYTIIMDQYQDYADAGGTSAPNPKNTYIEQRLLDLRDKLKPYLLYRTLYNSCYSLATKLTNKGVTEQSSDYSQNADLKMIENIKAEWKTKSEDYMKIVLDFIIENSSDYPEYTTYSCDGEASPSPYDNGGLYLGEEL